MRRMRPQSQCIRKPVIGNMAETQEVSSHVLADTRNWFTCVWSCRGKQKYPDEVKAVIGLDMAVPCVLRLRQEIDKFAGGIIDEG